MSSGNHSITLAAPAKINLSLRILGKRPDGFHELETFMVPLTVADEIEIAHGRGKEITLTCNDPDLPTGSDNLCVKAVEAFREEVGLDDGITISLLKRIPHGAGLGGGSSDAAAVLKGLNELFDHPLINEELHQIASRLGSDIPFFLGDGSSWCRGRGELLEPAAGLPHRKLLLIKPPFPVSTVWAYKKYAELKQSGRLPAQAEHQSLGEFEIVNDLEAPVFEKYILLPVMKSWLRQQAAVESAFMTGSGSTMVAVMEARATEDLLLSLKTKIAEEYGETCWTCVTTFSMPG
jgi:4-diphosphocytidyl-2-C-methyl-D-erythritol kinase